MPAKMLVIATAYFIYQTADQKSDNVSNDDTGAALRGCMKREALRRSIRCGYYY